MDELSETELRYYCDLFKICSESDSSGKIPALKATGLFRSANLSNEIINKITSLVGIPQTALHLSRQQFYGCLKLIAAYQASIPLREEILTSSMTLPLPRFSWKDSPPSSTSTSVTDRNGFNREWCEVRSPDLIELARDTLSNNEMTNSDQPSTDSEVEHNDDSMLRSAERHIIGVPAGSPEAWSTASDSPTPTNSVAERPWAKGNLWQGLLCEEQRQLLGTEEESSDKHSSDDDQDIDLEYFYQILPTQKEYYLKQFRSIQPDVNGLVTGSVARVFFEKSRIPVEELRNIWQMCDVTRDGALNLAEFTAAMHLVVLRRNDIPVPSTLPLCLMPTLLQNSLQPKSLNNDANNVVGSIVGGTEEADLLHLESDDTDTDSKKVKNENKDYKRIVSHPDSLKFNHHHHHHHLKNNTNSTTVAPGIISQSPSSKLASMKIVNSSVSSRKTPPNISPPTLQQQQLSSIDHISPPTSKNNKDWNTASKEWTKFTESPTSNVSSPGPKPVNFDLQRTTQAIVSDPQILHPVPLRVTPVGAEAVDSSLVYTDVAVGSGGLLIIQRDDSSPKQVQQQHQPLQRDSLTNNDLRAIQRPQPKKPPSKGVGAIPPPPQREPSITSSTSGSDPMTTSLEMSSCSNFNNSSIINVGNNISSVSSNKKDQPPPPLPPPRPSQHRHARSSSLDLNKLKMTAGNVASMQKQMQDHIKMPPPEVPPRVTPPSDASTSFADFAHFPDATLNHLGSGDNNVTTIHLDASGNMPQALSRGNLTNSLIIGGQSSQPRTSAFEVYRKPATLSRNSQSPPSTSLPPLTSSRSVESSSVEYEKRVSLISENLRQVRFKSDQSMVDVLKHLKEQNILLLRLCNDLSEELLHIQHKKEEIRLKIEKQEQHIALGGGGPVSSTSSSTSGHHHTNV